jgi:hypothetical protein
MRSVWNAAAASAVVVCTVVPYAAKSRADAAAEKPQPPTPPPSITAIAPVVGSDRDMLVILSVSNLPKVLAAKVRTTFGPTGVEHECKESKQLDDKTIQCTFPPTPVPAKGAAPPPPSQPAKGATPPPPLILEGVPQRFTVTVTSAKGERATSDASTVTYTRLPDPEVQDTVITQDPALSLQQVYLTGENFGVPGGPSPQVLVAPATVCTGVVLLGPNALICYLDRDVCTADKTFVVTR